MCKNNNVTQMSKVQSVLGRSWHCHGFQELCANKMSSISKHRQLNISSLLVLQL